MEMLDDVDKKGMEEVFSELRKSVAQMDLILASLKEGVAVTAKDMTLIFANDAFANMLNQQRLFMIGKHIWEVLPFIKRVNNFESASESVAELQGIYEFDSAGKKIIVEMNTAYLPNVQEVVFVLRDITESREKEKELAKRVKELAEMNRFMVDRELKMIELKKEVEKYKKESNI